MGGVIGVNRCFGFRNLKRQVVSESTSCFMFTVSICRRLKDKLQNPVQANMCFVFFLHFLWACRIKPIVALTRAIFLAFYILKNHWMEIVTHSKWSIWDSRRLCTAFLAVFEYVIFYTCPISRPIANCFSILRHGE